MNFLDFLNAVLKHTGKLPELFGMIQELVAIVRRIAALFGAEAPAVAAMSDAEVRAADMLAAEVSNQNLSPLGLGEILPGLQLLFSLIAKGGTLGTILQTLLEQFLSKLNATE